MKKSYSESCTRTSTHYSKPYASPVTVDFVADGIRGRQVIDHGTNLLGDELVEHCIGELQMSARGIWHINILSMSWSVHTHTTTTHATEWRETREAE